MRAFSPPHSKRHLLYTGLRVPKSTVDREITHCPLISILSKPDHDPEVKRCLAEVERASHLLFTSQTAVNIFFSKTFNSIHTKQIIAIGASTAKAVARAGYRADWIAKEATSEGVVELLKKLDLTGSHLLWPHSAQSREVIGNYLIESSCRYVTCALYDVVTHLPPTLPDITAYQEVMFTSPSTVRAYWTIYQTFYPGVVYTPIGPVTREYLSNLLRREQTSGRMREKSREGERVKIKTIHAIVEGKVQGVFFRDNTRRLARELNLNGWVRNLPTGEVELIASGAESSIQLLIEWLWKGPKMARVANLKWKELEYQPFDRFTVLR